MIVTNSMHTKIQATEDIMFVVDEEKQPCHVKIKKVLLIWLFLIESNNNNWRFGYKNRIKRGAQLLQFLESNAAISC